MESVEKYIGKLKSDINTFGMASLSKDEAIDVWYYLTLYQRLKDILNNPSTEEAAEEYAKDNFAFYDKEETKCDYEPLKEAFKAGSVKPLKVDVISGDLWLETENGEKFPLTGLASTPPMGPNFILP